MNRLFKCISVVGLALVAATASAQTAGTPEMLTGQVALPATDAPDSWTQVTFTDAFSSTPVVFHLIDDSNLEASALRIRNVTTTGFEIAQWEFNSEAYAGDDNTAATAMTVPWVAAEQGDWLLPDGTHMTIGLLKAGGTIGWGADSWFSHTFPTAFGARPAIIPAIQSAFNETISPAGPACPGLTEGMDNPSATGCDYGLDRMQIIDNTCYTGGSEIYGYMAIDDNAAGQIELLDGTWWLYEAIASDREISGAHDMTNTGVGTGASTNCDYLSFQHTYAAPPTTVGGQNSFYGGDGGWMTECDISTTQIGLNVDEDQSLDAERNHTTEIASIFALGKPPITIDKFVKAVFDPDGNYVGVTGPAYSNYVIYYVISYNIHPDYPTFPYTVYDFFETSFGTFIDTVLYNSTNPDAQYIFDVGSDGAPDQVLEWDVTGDGNIQVHVEIN